MAVVPLSRVCFVTLITPVVLTTDVEFIELFFFVELFFFLSFFESLLIRASVRSEILGRSFLRNLSGSSRPPT